MGEQRLTASQLSWVGGSRCRENTLRARLVGLPHDAVEDHASGLTPGCGCREALALLPADLVSMSLSLRPRSPTRTTRRTETSISSTPSTCRPPGGQLVAAGQKASGFTGNAVGPIHATRPKPQRLAGKYAPLVPALRQLILRPGHAAGLRRQDAHYRTARLRRRMARRNLVRTRHRDGGRLMTPLADRRLTPGSRHCLPRTLPGARR